MNKIEFEQINENEIEVIIPPETPIIMVQQLTKSLLSRGLVEDLQKSTLSVRYFYRPEDKINDLADKLIKSLSDMAKEDELPYWHPKAQMANQKRIREAGVAERRAKPNISKKPTPNVSPSGAGIIPYDDPSTAGGTGKRYAYINDIKKEEDDVEKSNYGPKGAGQYSQVDNAKRKAKNLDPVEGIGPNVNAKAYSSKPGQLSGKQSATLTARIQNKANKKQPVKVFTPEEIAAKYNPDGTLKKSWGQHLPFPSAEEEIMNLAKGEDFVGEQVAATQLMNLMAGKSMLGVQPPPQPTDEQMFGHLAVSEEIAKKAQNEWNGTINNWLVEATKPISQRFSSEEEEIAYWNSIKVADRDGSEPGY